MNFLKNIKQLQLSCFFILFVLFFISISSSFAQGNNTCANAQPFCTGSTVNYPAQTNAGSAQVGPNYGCLGSQPNPAWFSLQILTAGPIILQMSAGNDIDFICYGPFPNLTGNCNNLTGPNTVGCSYSGSNVETCTIANALPGQNYLILITNYSNVVQNITFTQTNSNAPGAGTTNCGILCNFTATASGTLCSTKTATFAVTTGTNILSVTWNGPNGFSSLIGNTSIPNITTLASGVYTAIATTTGTNPATNTCVVTKTITVIPTPTPIVTGATVCAGSPINLTSNFIANTNYNWSGPNAFSSNTQNPVIPNASTLMTGPYNLTVTTSVGNCTNTAVANVSVISSPSPSLTSNSPICAANTLSLTGGGGGTYSWLGPNGFASVLQNPNISNATTLNSGNYTLTVTGVGGCTASVTSSITINPTPTIATTGATVCAGNTINLTATSLVGSVYNWSGPNGFSSVQQNPSIVSSTTLMSGTYSLLVTSASGCTNTAVANVSVITLPTPSLSSNSPVCATKTLNLTASGATTYSWLGPNGFTSTLQNPSITNVSILATGVYTLIGTSGTCSASTTANITINALPTPNIVSNSPVCQAQTLNLQGSGGVSYAWTGPNGFTSTLQNPSISNAQLVNGGTYSLTVTAANTCSNTTNALITVNATPPALATGSTVCAGQNLALTANILAGATYAWSGPNGFTSNLQNPVITNAQLSATGAYNLIVTSSVGCTNTAVTNASVIALPIPILGSNSPVCATKTLNLTGNGGNSYAWVGPNNFTSIQQNPIINNVTTLGSGMYTLVATVGNCSAAVTASITINALPTPIAANTGSVCETKSLTLTSNGGTSYSWTGPNNFTSNQQNPVINATALSQSGVYVVVVTDVNGCVNNAQTTVLINPNPSVIASGGIYCVGNSASVTANGGSVYNWSGPNGFTSNLQSPQLGNATFLLAGNYVVLVTAANTCTSINSASVGVVQLVQPTISNNGPICVNQQLSFTSSGGYIYSWVGPNNFVSNQANPSIIADDMGYAGTYMLTVADNNGCSNSVSTQVVINPLPTGELISSSTKNCVPFCANFSVTSTNSNLQATTWINTNGGTVTGNVLSRCFTTAGDYNFKASYTDNNGCTNTSSFVATAYPLPVADFNFTPEKPIEAIDEVYFTDATTIGGPATQWTWWFMNNSTIRLQQNPTFLFENPGTYPVALVVKNKWGCADTVVKNITINEDFAIYLPNTFTPNDDGINDVFAPKGLGVVKYTMTIYDRWGEKLFTTNDFTKGWDGTYKGVNCKNDVYVYKMSYYNNQDKKIDKTGHVTISR